MVFLGVLFGSWLDMTVGIDPTPVPTENRALSRWPGLPSRPGELPTFAAAVADYFHDQFGFRRLLLAWNQRAKLALGESPSARVLLGQEQWLFYSGNETVEEYLALRRLSAGDLATWQRTLRERQARLARQGARYLFVVAPDKMSVYPEHLPAALTTRPGHSTREQLEQLEADAFLPMVDDLRAEKSRGLLYYRTDTHWTPVGLTVAADTIARRLALPPATSGVSHERVTHVHGGDLARMLDGPPQYAEQIVDSQPVGVTPATGEETAIEWHSPSLGSTVTAVAIRFNGRGESAALMFGDSFGRSLAPYVAARFASLTFVPMHPDDETFAVMVDRFRPQTVLEERAERYLKYPPRATPWTNRLLGWMAAE